MKRNKINLFFKTKQKNPNNLSNKMLHKATNELSTLFIKMLFKHVHFEVSYFLGKYGLYKKKRCIRNYFQFFTHKVKSIFCVRCVGMSKNSSESSFKWYKDEQCYYLGIYIFASKQSTKQKEGHMRNSSSSISNVIDNIRILDELHLKIITLSY